MRAALSSVLVLLLASYCLGQSTSLYASPTCSFGEYDLTKLQYDPNGTPPPGYSFYNTADKDTLNINFCAQVALSVGCSGTTSANPPIAAPGSCQLSGTSYQVCGDATNVKWAALSKPYQPPNTALNFTEGVSMTYLGGTICPGISGSPNRQTTVLVVCPPDGYTGLKEQIIGASEASCVYSLLFVSQYGCIGGGPTGGSSGGVDVGWILILILSVFFFVYVVIGIAIKFKKYEARGLELVPNYDFWKEVPFYIKDGNVFLIQKISCGKLCGGYSAI